MFAHLIAEFRKDLLPTINVRPSSSHRTNELLPFLPSLAHVASSRSQIMPA
jgi:hypothetical protein